MEKTDVSGTTEKVSNNDIYNDAALVILSKLPLKSLIRFFCVRKSWSLLFENPYFMSMFRINFLCKNHSYYDDTPSILLEHVKPWVRGQGYGKPILYSLFGESFENKLILDWPNPFQEDEFSFYIPHPFSVNGILCIEDAGRPGGIRCIEEHGRIALWNPARGESKVIPISPFPFEHPCWDPSIKLYGFGYDKVRDDYKVIRYVTFFTATDGDFETWDWEVDGWKNPVWEIYSLKSNNWKKLDLDMLEKYYCNVGVQVYMDGVCHWWGETETNFGAYLVSFDLNSETFVKTPIPSHVDHIDSEILFRHLDVLNGSIGWISNIAETNTFHISVLGEVGVEESWIKLFVVGPFPLVEHPIGVGNKGDILFRKKDDELVWFNLITQRIEELGIIGDSRCRIIVYRENLLPIE